MQSLKTSDWPLHRFLSRRFCRSELLHRSGSKKPVDRKKRHYLNAEATPAGCTWFFVIDGFALSLAFNPLQLASGREFHFVRLCRDPVVECP